MMKYTLTAIAAAGALAIIALSPGTAEAGWRHGGWGGGWGPGSASISRGPIIGTIPTGTVTGLPITATTPMGTPPHGGGIATATTIKIARRLPVRLLLWAREGPFKSRRNGP